MEVIIKYLKLDKIPIIPTQHGLLLQFRLYFHNEEEAYSDILTDGTGTNPDQFFYLGIDIKHQSVVPHLDIDNKSQYSLRNYERLVNLQNTETTKDKILDFDDIKDNEITYTEIKLPLDCLKEIVVKDVQKKKEVEQLLNEYRIDFELENRGIINKYILK